MEIRDDDYRYQNVRGAPVPVHSLAPCPDSKDGLHCPHDVMSFVDGVDEFKCCWCELKVIVKTELITKTPKGHGPGAAQKWEEYVDWPPDWKEY